MKDVLTTEITEAHREGALSSSVSLCVLCGESLLLPSIFAQFVGGRAERDQSFLG